ncbi:TPA: hypothetical protein DEP96_00015 [Candidatus Uhrbacteria bacterium]|nr:hypothetical protein [Candidatus Uhrbacteria bacterium]
MKNTAFSRVLLTFFILALSIAVVYFIVIQLTPKSTTPTPTPAPTNDQIHVTSPATYSTVLSPLTITGEARGSWFFEASFPIRLIDANNNVLATGIATAQSDWMTTNFVPFQASLTFPTPITANGTLILQKDNPSGLPEHDDELRVPINFQQNTRTIKLYYYNPAKDKDVMGNIQCSAQGLESVNRVVAVTITPIQDSLKLLIQGSLTSTEKAQGLTTEYPLSGVELKGANLKDGHLTLEFLDPQNKTSGGSCRASILWQQIDATAKQFPEVKSVSFIPSDLFQP